MSNEKTQPLPAVWFQRLTMETPPLRTMVDASEFRVTSMDLTQRLPVLR